MATTAMARAVEGEGARVPDGDIASIVRRAQNGDQSAFELLYREHVGHIYALCLRVSGDPARAEELTQDAFVRAWAKLGSFRGEAAFSSWLYRLALNVVSASRRSERRRWARVRTMVESSSSQGSSAESAPAAGIDLERAIRSLPAGARAVFVLHDIDGYGHKEIAELMGVAPGTSKAQLHRARRLLREALER